MNAEKRTFRPAVPFTDATLPARVLMSYVRADCVTALDGRTAMNAIAAATMKSTLPPAMRRCDTTRFRSSLVSKFRFFILLVSLSVLFVFLIEGLFVHRSIPETKDEVPR